MARKDIIQGAPHSLERFKEESPEWLAEARKVMATWGDGEYLVTAVAKGLKDAYERGAAGKKASTAHDATRIRRRRTVRGS